MAMSVLLAIVTVFQCLTVAVHSFVINYNTPHQCGDVQISWTTSPTPAAQLQFPLLLHIIPFDSNAISYQIPGWNTSTTSGSAAVNFGLNLTNGTTFLLAVTDQIGTGVGSVSDVMTVAASQDTSCLSTNSTISPSHFLTFTTPTPSDCPSLTVTWDSTVKSPRPTIIGFSPGQTPVNMDPPFAPSPVERSVQINGTFTSQSRVVVLFRDDNSSGPSWTSQFLTIGGLDKADCSAVPSALNAWASSSPTASAMPLCDLKCSNKTAGRVVGGIMAACIGFAILLYAVFVYVRRRHRKAVNSASDSEKGSPATEKALPSSPFESTNTPNIGVMSSPIAATNTELEGHSMAKQQEDQKQQEDTEQEDESKTPTTATSVAISHASPLPLPGSPLSGWTSRSTPTTTSPKSSIFLHFVESSSIVRPPRPNENSGGATPMMPDESGPVSRPDSPTIPESKFQRASTVAVPSTPTSARKSPRFARSRSQRSQRSQRREEYSNLDVAADFTISAGEICDPHSGSLMSLGSIGSRMTGRKAQ